MNLLAELSAASIENKIPGDWVRGVQHAAGNVDGKITNNLFQHIWEDLTTAKGEVIVTLSQQDKQVMHYAVGYIPRTNMLKHRHYPPKQSISHLQ